MNSKLHIFSKVIFLSIVFWGSNVLGYFGIQDVTFQAGLMALALVPMLAFYSTWIRNWRHVALLAFVVIAGVVKMKVDGGEGSRAMAVSIIGAPLLLTVFPPNTLRHHFLWKSVFLIFLTGFLTETGLAIFERLIGHSTFGWHAVSSIFTVQDLGTVGYRSTGLYGHPLYNALMVSTAMSFILISPLKYSVKFSLWGIGYLSILCFNTRSSIVGNAVLLIAYLAYTFMKDMWIRKKINTKLIVWTLFIMAIAGGFIFYGGWGGRLLDMGLMDDDSAMVRVNVWDIFKFNDWHQFLYGKSSNSVSLISYQAGIGIIENFWIVFALRMGIIFLVIYIVLYALLITDMLRPYALFEKLFVTSAFWLIASTNNSLSSSFIALFYYLVLLRLFSPKGFRRIVPSKYLV